MFGENEYFGSAEMSLEATLKYLKKVALRPPDLSDDDWDLIVSGGPYDEDALDQLRTGLLDSMSQSEGVLTLGWDGEGPGHSGVKTIAKWAGCFIFDSSDHDDHGPFRRIEQALELEYFWQEGVPKGELWFDGDVVPSDIAFKIAHAMCGDEGETVRVNDVEYTRIGDKLERTAAED